MMTAQSQDNDYNVMGRKDGKGKMGGDDPVSRGGLKEIITEQNEFDRTKENAKGIMARGADDQGGCFCFCLPFSGRGDKKVKGGITSKSSTSAASQSNTEGNDQLRIAKKFQ